MLAAGRRRSLQRALALAAIEACEVPAARKRSPNHAIRIDVDAPRRIADDTGRRIERRFVALADACLRIDADDLPGHGSRHGAPDTAIGWMRNDAVNYPDGDLPIDGRIHLSVLIQVVPRPAPALRLRFVAGLVENPGIDPADGAAEHAVAVKGLVLVGRELHVVRVEADVHLLELARLRIEVLDLAETRLLRREGSRRMRPAEGGLVLGKTESRRHPDAALAVHRRVIRDRRIVPIELVAPV